MTTLTLDTNDVNGAKTRLVSNPFAVSLGSGTLLDSVKIICGGTVYESVGICQDHHTFFLPEDADLKHLKTTFITNGMSVTADGNPVVSGETEIDYSRDVTFKVTSVSGEEKSYIVSAYDFDLPVLYIETPDHQPITSKEEWVKDAVAVLFNGDAVDTMPTSIKGRGNSTWGNPKKPYTLKLDKKTEVLGMPEDKRWNLLANYFDRTLIRNAVAFEIARQTGLAWTPRGRHVEVIMNGSHQGNYYLCEHIKVSKNRIDIKEMKSDDTTGKKITGGYVVELDFRYDEVNKFKTTKRKLPVNIKSPDDDVMVPSQLAYIRNYFDSLEAVLYTDDFTEKRKYLDYIDVNSFIDWWIAYELTETNEPTGPLSSYMYKDRGGKLCAGPVWDFDIKTFLPDVNHFRIKDAIYYTQLFKDDIFMEAVKVRWNNHKPGFESVCTYIDKIAGIVEKSDSRNHDMWPLPSHLPSWAENGDGHLSFPDAVARLKGAYQQRLQWLDEHINAL